MSPRTASALSHCALTAHQARQTREDWGLGLRAPPLHCGGQNKLLLLGFPGPMFEGLGQASRQQDHQSPLAGDTGFQPQLHVTQHFAS